MVGKVELKDMILSTLAELEDSNVKEDEKPKETVELKEEVLEENKPLHVEIETTCTSDERAFCESMRERILVLFEGFQSPNNKSIEAKVDLTLNFLEYSLAVLDERLEKLDNK